MTIFAAIFTLVALLGVAACGGGGSDSTATSAREVSEAEPEKVQSIDMTVTSSAVKEGDRGLELTPSFVCKPGDFPSLKWSNVPKGAKEVVVFALPVEGIEGHNEFSGAIAGIDPSSKGIASGKVPDGAVIGKNSDGKEDFSLCPSSAKEQFAITVLAPEKLLEPEAGFDPEQVRNEALAASEQMGLLLFSAPKK